MRTACANAQVGRSKPQDHLKHGRLCGRAKKLPGITRAGFEKGLFRAEVASGEYWFASRIVR